MLFANLLLRAPAFVVFATATRLLWSTSLDTKVNFAHATHVVSSGGGVRDTRTGGIATNSTTSSSSAASAHSSTNHATLISRSSRAAAAHDKSFRLDNLDLSVPISCGKKKCLFTLRTDPTIGYLVLSSDGDAESKLKKLTVAWLYAKHLEVHYNSKHLFLGGPKELKMSTEFADRLNEANLTRLAVNGVMSSKAPSFSKGIVLAQKVRVAPKNSLLVGCERKFDHAVERLDEFVSFIDDKKMFVKNFEEQVAVMRNVLNVKENRCLLRDFQVLVDTMGNINHIDLDRCPLGSKYKKGFNDHARVCTAQFDELVNRCKKAALAS